MQWGPWSPQVPKKANRGGKKKEETAKEQQGAGVLRAYDATPSGSSSTSSASNSSGQQEALFFKEFVNFVKETKCELPENLQKYLPDEGKESLREEQRKINKKRNLMTKISNKQKALEQDNQKWSEWVASVKEEVQKQRTKHEESQKRISQELVDLQAELKKMDNAEEEVMETEEDQEIDELLAEATKEVTEASNTAKLEEMQAAMEAQYQQRIMEERQRMQQYFSEQFINLARVNIDPYMQQEGMNMTPEAEEGKDATADGPPGLTVRNVRAPFGVQRVSKANQVTSPYRRQEEKDKLTMEQRMAVEHRWPNTSLKIQDKRLPSDRHLWDPDLGQWCGNVQLGEVRDPRDSWHNGFC